MYRRWKMKDRWMLVWETNELETDPFLFFRVDKKKTGVLGSMDVENGMENETMHVRCVRTTSKYHFRSKEEERRKERHVSFRFVVERCNVRIRRARERNACSVGISFARCIRDNSSFLPHPRSQSGTHPSSMVPLFFLYPSANSLPSEG